MADAAELNNVAKFVLLPLFAVVNGYLLGSSLRDADAYFLAKQKAPKINFMNTDGDIKVKVDYGFSIDFMASGLKALFEPIIPKGCDSFTSLFQYIFKEASRGTRIKSSFGAIMIGAVLNSDLDFELLPLYAACTYLANGYFRGDTGSGFYVNPVGVTCKKLGEITGVGKYFTGKGQTLGEQPKDYYNVRKT